MNELSLTLFIYQNMEHKTFQHLDTIQIRSQLPPFDLFFQLIFHTAFQYVFSNVTSVTYKVFFTA